LREGSGMVDIECADAAGERCGDVLRGDAAVVRERRDAGIANSRARMAVEAELAKIRPVTPVVPIAADKLRREREAVAARGGIVAKTAGKVATDEHTWELFVEEQGIEVESYPSEDTVVEFAVSTLRDELQHVCV
jgi:hypothetical protein